MKKYCLTETRKAVSDDATVAAMNTRIIETGSDLFSPDEISDALSSAPVMNDINLTEIHGLSFKGDRDSKGDRIIEFLSSAAEELDEASILIVSIPDGNIDTSRIEKGKPSKAVAELAKNFSIVYFRREDSARLKQWLSKQFVKEGIGADPSLCAMIIDRCGSDMFALKSEAEKLCDYLHSKNRDRLTREDIELITPASPEYGAFDFADAVLNRNLTKAYDILRLKKLQKESPEAISASISSLYSNMLLIKTYEECGMSSQEISRETGIHEFRIKKMENGMRGLPRKILEAVCEICVQADLMIKSSPGDKYIQIERMLGTVISMTNS